MEEKLHSDKLTNRSKPKKSPKVARTNKKIAKNSNKMPKSSILQFE